MTDFAEKNRRRKAMDPARRRKARTARKQYGVNGAFGWLREKYPDLHHLCATGTKTALAEESAA